MKKIFFVFILFVSVLFSCKNNESEKKTDEVQTSDTVLMQNQVIFGKEYTSKFICPNHCPGSGNIEPGTCPVCGMEYIENFDYKEN